jgi:hypothetical protein
MSMTFYPTSVPSNGKELSRLLTAAVVNQKFCKLLLTNPARALDAGYNGEAFRLATDEKDRILSIRANSLADFAMQLAGGRIGNVLGHVGQDAQVKKSQ